MFGLDLKKITEAAKEKPAKAEPEATSPLPVNRLKPSAKKLVATAK